MYVYESIKLKKGEQNDIARKFFRGLGGGFGLCKKYECLLCGQKVEAPSPRLAALYHRHEHPEFEQAFRDAGLHDFWNPDKEHHNPGEHQDWPQDPELEGRD